MRKYLDMENATLEVQFKNIKDYSILLDNNSNEIILQNFKRVIFHIDEKYIKELYDILKEKFENENILAMIYSNITKIPKYDVIDNIIFVNTNESNIIKSDNIFNLISLKDDNVKKVADIIKDDSNIMINPIIDVNNISKFFETFNELTELIDGKRINLNGYIIPSFLMREHPCNAYLCDGCHCKKEISCLPKYITINSDFEVYPHDLFYNKLRIGNINNKKITDVLEKYYSSDSYNEFIKYSKKVFIKYLSHYPYQYMPIVEYIRMEIENDK
ncbi:MAG: hypothetical protein IJ105_03700 [Bacilli bacterium]|nr:hypothetical protein [Bacilli bacterium]